MTVLRSKLEGHDEAARKRPGSGVGRLMRKYHNYWVYSIGCLLVWALLLAVVASSGGRDKTHNVLLVFAGWGIAWVSTTIARFVYPPPKRWLEANRPTP
jgi:hypothetical protein